MDKLTYTNSKGQVCFFREVTGKRGTQIVCSQKESGNDLQSIPETHEIMESPNGQVSCRKKVQRDLLPEEITFAREYVPKLAGPKTLLFTEVKKKALIIHFKETSRVDRMIKHLPFHRIADLSFLAANIPFQPMLKLELSDKASRTFAVFRMCWMGEPEWMFLEERPLTPLLEKYVPHIGKESFYELL